ncbi:MAG: hypothetical protein AAF957_25370 [Planctomycetota bacterium]
MTTLRPLAGLVALAAALAPIETTQAQQADVQALLDALPEATDGDRVHSAAVGPCRVSSLFRSERGLDKSAREALEIVEAVRAAYAASGGSVDGGAFELFLAEHPVALRKALPSGGGQRGGPLAAVQAFRRGPFPAVAIAPRVHDRTLFGTGLPPVTRRLVAVTAARALQPGGLDLTGERDELAFVLAEGRVRLIADEALRTAKAARSLEEDPVTSSGLVALRRELAPFAAEERARALVSIATSWRPTNAARWSGATPLGNDHGAAAVRLLAAVDLPGDAPLLDRATAALERLDALRPQWIVEGGAVGGHPYGWQTVATRQRDALALSAEPHDGEPFTLKAAFAVFSNDLQVSPQADIVFGDQDGDRLLLACNAHEGLYLFRRSAAATDYEILAESAGARPPIGKEVEATIRFDGEVLKIEVGGVKMVPVRVAGRTLAGRWGFGAHAGSTAMFRTATMASSK